MRIIIVQAEIELAIRQYVLGQINIAEGQDITIDFKNTRGDDGATAEINISKPTGNEQAAPVKAETPKPVQTTTKASTASPAPAVAATAPTSSEPEQSADSASSTTANTEPASTANKPSGEPEKEGAMPERTVPFDADDPVDGGDTPDVTDTIQPVKKPSFLQPAAETPATPPSGGGKSLFANLTKPVNPKPDAA